VDIVNYSKVDKSLVRLPKHILVEFRTWVQTIETVGLEKAQRTPRYRDHSLKGEWKGFRAVSFGRAYRAIYEVNKSKEIRIINVERVSKHDYRKK
jgi:addiction module RelE/StbE family toxin